MFRFLEAVFLKKYNPIKPGVRCRFLNLQSVGDEKDHTDKMKEYNIQNFALCKFRRDIF